MLVGTQVISLSLVATTLSTQNMWMFTLIVRKVDARVAQVTTYSMYKVGSLGVFHLLYITASPPVLGSMTGIARIEYLRRLDRSIELRSAARVYLLRPAFSLDSPFACPSCSSQRVLPPVPRR